MDGKTISLNVERKMRAGAAMLKAIDKNGVPGGVRGYIYDKPALQNAISAPDMANLAKSLDAWLLACIWMAIGSGMNVIITSPDPVSNRKFVSLAANFAHRIEKLHIVARSKGSVWASDRYRNMISLYGKTGAPGLVSKQIGRSAELHADRVIVDEITGREAESLFAIASQGIPFVCSVRAAEAGMPLLRRLCARPFFVNPDCINEIDMAITLDPLGRIKSIAEYRWLSRAEIEEGEALRNLDSVSIAELAAGGAIDAERLRNSKTVLEFGKQRGLSPALSFAELEARRDMMAKLPGYAPAEWISLLSAFRNRATQRI